MLGAELSHRLATERVAGEEVGNHRNGSAPKTVLTPNGAVPLEIPRDRIASFDPVLVAKHRRR
jgi:transposase-like protein